MPSSWRKTAWSIEGGAEHGSDLLRLLAYAGTLGSEGVVTSKDCKVTTGVDIDMTLHVAKGSVVALNRYPAGDRQSYVLDLPSTDYITLGVPGGAPRSDLIVARVLDPQYEGSFPVDPNDFQYVYTEVITGVPDTTVSAASLSLGYPAVALARIDLPASATFIDEDMIVDVRELVRPRTKRHQFVFNPVVEDGIDPAADYDAPDDWPFLSAAMVLAPEWATRVTIRVDVTGAYLDDGPAHGGFNITFEDRIIQGSQYNADTIGERVALMAAGSTRVNTAERNTYVTTRTTAFRNFGTGALFVDETSTIVMEIEFFEEPE